MIDGVRPAQSDDERMTAVAVWAATKQATGASPSSDRTARVDEKVAEHSAVVLLAFHDGELRGMALAEPFREGPAGPDREGWGHVGMVFVEPDAWGRGLGRRLLRSLQSCPERWTRLSLWTGTGNERARRLYAGAGFVDSGDRAVLPNGDPIMRLEW